MSSNKVFVVHGRNEKIRKSMFVFLRSIGLEPLEWSKIRKETKKTDPYIGEVLDTGFAMAQAVVILMTPDDEAKLKEEFVKDSEHEFEKELTPQPRQNVLIEAGMGLGKFPEQTIIVQFGKLREISDILGKHVIRFDGSVEQRHELAQRLSTCGCEVDTSGNDWLSVGDFELKEKPSGKDWLSDGDFELKEKPSKMESESIQSKSDKEESTNHSGPSGGIQFLIDNGFFTKPKTLGEIIKALKENDYHYPNTTINGVLTTVFFKGRKTLNKIMKNGKWTYVFKK